MKKTTAVTITEYNNLQTNDTQAICTCLQTTIDKYLKKSESKLWHGSPVWFIDGNPIVSYSVRKGDRVSLMFFSGQDFNEKELIPEGSFKAAEIFYENMKEINTSSIKRWLAKGKEIQWDYKNIIKNKGLLKKREPSTAITEKKSTALSAHDKKIATMTFGLVYPMYVAKVEKKNRTKQELDKVITWLTGFDKKTIQKFSKAHITFETFFKEATLNKNAYLITGMICGYRLEEIQNPLTKKVRYLDKLVDELAKGRPLEKILRTA